MSLDIVALLTRQPDPAAMLRGVTGPNGPLDVRQDAGTVHMHDPGGPLLVSVEEPVYVEVPGEPERLLGTAVPTPVWWVEIRAAAGPDQAALLARGIADEFVRRYGGTVWAGGS
jgi:hypothetical protein